ncbi:alkylhydroperoxidase family enzyme [Clostridium pascui]|uniref:carboxymuconolactone decarboxylase family protein n=1 Tax=Clostridium pascui TaxID=46609 RepID=UPI00195D63FD|nr:carboxymuconolactone decarboxylase family protein [Clostridium pascui]MBM7871254.1 alkylhydroperoxidase family enzyme [Clostridium pascui]
MARIVFSHEGFTPFQQLLGHNKDILEKWTDLENSIFNSNTFSAELKEEVRRTLAFNNGCQYCMAKGRPSNNISNLKVLTAVKFADMSSKNISFDNIHFSALKEEFDDKEISELFALICFITACQKFGALLDLQPNCSI